MGKSARPEQQLESAPAGMVKTDKPDESARSGAYRIMSHMVAWYPDRERSLEAARALIDGGASFLEVQFPFSDPTADGPVIQEACTTALKAGFKVDEGFRLVEDILDYRNIPLFIMSYAGPVYAKGIDRFVSRAKDAGARALIVPDLMPGYDEGLYRKGLSMGIEVVPVVAPTVSPSRLSRILELEREYIYAALRVGITGAFTDLTKVKSFISTLRSSGSKILAGFGIRTASQVKTLAPHVYALVVGSALVEVIADCLVVSQKSIYTSLKNKIETLVNGG